MQTPFLRALAGWEAAAVNLPGAAAQTASALVVRKSRRNKRGKVPPQLIDILADAVAMGATSFRLQTNLPHIMASFSAGSQATEIDFEPWSGREMMGYFAAHVTDRKTHTGRFTLEYDGRQYECQVTLNRRRDPQQADVAWT